MTDAAPMRAVPRPAVLVVAALALAIVGALWRPLSPACLVAAGALVTAAAAGNDRVLLTVALLAFAVRAALGVGLEWVIGLDVPALRPVQENDLVVGYRAWTFALDAKWYHFNALHMLKTWTEGIEFPYGTAPAYVVVVATVYRLFGAHPVNAMLCNALFGALTVVMGHRIADRTAGRTAARVTAVLMAFWPSAVLWSAQLLKDTLCVLLILTVLHLTLSVVEPPPPDGSRRRAVARATTSAALLFAAAFVLYHLRVYVVVVLALVPAVFVLHGLARRTRQTPWRVSAAFAAMAVIVLGAATAHRVTVERMFAPSHPARARVNIGVVHHTRGDLSVAARHYERALQIAPEYPPALKRLAILAVARDDRSRAIAGFERYLVRVPDDAAARAALDAVRAAPAGASVRGLPMPDVTFDLSSPTTFAAAPPAPTVPRAGPQLGAYRSPLGVVLGARYGFVKSRGYSDIDVDVPLRGYRDVLLYVPRAVSNAFLVPYPSQWFDVGGSTRFFRLASAGEAILVYILIVPLVVGVGVLVWRGSPEALYLLTFIAVISALLGLVITNVGTLFRLRLEPLMPLFAAGSFGWVWLLRRCRWLP